MLKSAHVSKLFPVLIISSIPFLLGCDSVIKKMASIYTTKVIVKNESERTCIKTFRGFAAVVEKSKSAVKDEEKLVVFSKENDERLLQLDKEFAKKLEAPEQTAAEKLYGQSKTYDKSDYEKELAAQEEYLKELTKTFPKQIEKCKETAARLYNECEEKYHDNVSVNVKCAEFNQTKPYLEMATETALFSIMSEKEQASFKAQLKETFEENAQKLLAAKESEADTKKKTE